MNLRVTSAGIATLALALAAPSAEAQSVVLDEGRFTVFLDGREVGTESFRIHRDGMGNEANLVATAEIQLRTDDGTTEMRPSLRTGASMVPQAYENKISGTQVAQVNGWLDGNRFVARVASQEGESQKEYRANTSTVILEENVAYLYYFAGALTREGGSTLSVVVPASGAQYRLQVLSSAVEPFRLGREQLEVRHVRLEGPDQLHEVWFDEQGRVMRVEIPSRGYRAERTPS